MWMDISGARAVFVITETQYIEGHLDIAIIAQTRGDKTISPQRGITSPSLTPNTEIERAVTWLCFSSDNNATLSFWSEIPGILSLTEYCKMLEVSVNLNKFERHIRTKFYCHQRLLHTAEVSFTLICWQGSELECVRVSWVSWRVMTALTCLTISMSLLSHSLTFLLTPKYSFQKVNLQN